MNIFAQKDTLRIKKQNIKRTKANKPKTKTQPQTQKPKTKNQNNVKVSH